MTLIGLVLGFSLVIAGFVLGVTAAAIAVVHTRKVWTPAEAIAAGGLEGEDAVLVYYSALYELFHLTSARGWNGREAVYGFASTLVSTVGIVGGLDQVRSFCDEHQLPETREGWESHLSGVPVSFKLSAVRAISSHLN